MFLARLLAPKSPKVPHFPSLGIRPRSDRSSERRPRPPPPDRPSRARARKPEAANRKWRAGEEPLEVTGKGLGGSYHLEEMRDIDERINKLNHFLTQVIQERA